MSSEGSSPFGIVFRLTVILLISVSILTSYSSLLVRLTEGMGDPTLNSLSKVLPGANEFRPVLGGDGSVLYYEAYDRGGALLGFGFIGVGRGMWGEIKIAGGIDLNYRVTNIIVLEQGETPGLGAKIAGSQFLDQFDQLSADESRLTKFGGEVDAITGASISSRALTDIVRTEIERVVQLREEAS
jgi:electron transport complex protein RnfG